jgi:hypothetical protein
MRHRAIGAGLLMLLASFAACPGFAAAGPVSGPHETLDFRFTTTHTSAPTGWTFTGSYHAAGNPDALPPYMRKMTFYHPPGMRFDTSVPGRCTASDVELVVRGADACPADSRLGGGPVWVSLMGGSPRQSSADLFNNTNEQVILGQSPLLTTVVRSRMRPDGSVEYASPTCFPSVPGVRCPVDDLLQVKSSITVPPYTRASDGSVRSYLTTPPECPASGHWETPVRLWWADGSVDTVVTEQPCTRGALSFGAGTLVTLELATRRIPAKGLLGVRVSNANPRLVTGKLSGQTVDRVSGARKQRVELRATSFRVAAHARKTVELRLPKVLRRLLKREGKLKLRLTAKVKDPAGNTRTVKKRVTPRLKKRRR